ncbi:MAG: aldehyde dehydrogenase family protein [Candidatus Acidiferrales bacterium]
MAATKKAAKLKMKNFIAGEWTDEGAEFDVRAPQDNSLVGTTYLAPEHLLEEAIEASVHAFETTRKMPAYERRRVLRGIAERISKEREELARLMALEAGKPMRTARGEVERAIFTFEVAAEEAGRAAGEYQALDWMSAAAGRSAILRRFPLGPIAAITPFNFPLNLVAHKLAPAIAAGCTMVLKPAPKTPFCALRLARMAEEAGWPKGALSVLSLANTVAEQLVSDERIKLLTFTGSGTVGWELRSKAGKKRVALELGGNAGVIVHRDANLDYAAERVVQGGFSYAGQSCISVQRVFVERSVEKHFVEKAAAGVRKLKLGDPLDEKTDVGPMITEGAAKRAEAWIEEAVNGGAKLIAGGKRKGAYVEPTLLTHTTAKMKVNCEEVFAPVVTVTPYEDFGAAIRAINDSPWGLQAGVFTRDMKLLFQAYEELEVGGVMAGDVPTFRADQMPYGGTKDSGVGREGLRYAIEEMTEPRLLVLNAGG